MTTSLAVLREIESLARSRHYTFSCQVADAHFRSPSSAHNSKRGLVVSLKGWIHLGDGTFSIGAHAFHASGYSKLEAVTSMLWTLQHHFRMEDQKKAATQEGRDLREKA